jgi:DNA-binding transcriptional LysR family regulator
MHWTERVGRRLKLRDLHILLAVVQHRSMAKAASSLAISQPAVSKAIADMEGVLGLRLLDRGRHGVEPTSYGLALVKRGRAVFDELKSGVEELLFLADPAVGELRIGSSEAMAAGVLPAVIERFSHQHPRAHVSIAQALFATTQYRDLRERSIDLLLGRIPDPFAENDLEAEILFDDHVRIVVGKRSKWARSRTLKLADLADEPWILAPPDTLAGLLTVDLFRVNGLKVPRAPLTTLSIHLYCQLAASGRFVTVLPTSVLQFRGKALGLKMLPIKLPVQPRPVAFVKLKNRTLSPVAQRFVECAREITRPLRTRSWGRKPQVPGFDAQ